MSLINDEEFRAVFCEVLHKRGIATNYIAIDALKEKIQHDQEVELNIWSKNQNQSDPFTLTQWIQEANKKRELVAAVEDQIDSKFDQAQSFFNFSQETHKDSNLISIRYQVFD